MKFTFSWLKDHLKTDFDIYQIAEILTNIGLEVEKIENKSKDLKSFTTAYVVSVEKHPNADRLKICKVKTLKGIYQVVCGAPNVKKGMYGIFAPEGSLIPNTGVILKKTLIRHVESAGMLVSEKEMGISDNHNEIIEIDGSNKIGEPFSKIFGLDDPIIEIGITPNRGDCLSVRGIARDLAAAGAGKLKKLEYYSHKGIFKSPIQWKRSLGKNNDKLCSAVSGRYFKNIKNGESPTWLKKRLTAIGLRPISTIVDITNYITFDLGRPLHAFDADKINGDLIMRLSKKNEISKALNGQIYNLKENTVVIADNKQIHAIGGIMGGEESSCTKHTSNIFLEVALFDPTIISRTGRKLDLQSDARYRFERGVDPYSIEWGLNAATKMILNLCGGETSKISIAGNYKVKKKSIKYRFERVSTLGGVNISSNKQKIILNNLGFEISKEKNNTCIATIPTYRPDIDGEADLVEEVLRIYGYKNIKPLSVLKKQDNLSKPLNQNQYPRYKSKRLIAARGYSEVVTWSFISSKYANIFNQYNKVLKLDNPISNELEIMRPSILPNLIASINKNQSRLFDSAGIFEVGPQYENFTPDGQHMMASAIKYGLINSNIWTNNERPVDVFDIKADVYSILHSLSIPIEKLQLDYKTPNWYHPGKSSALRLGNKTLVFFGEISPSILNVFQIKSNVCAFEIFLDRLQNFRTNIFLPKKPFDNNPYQAVERDFAFILNSTVESSKITEAIKKSEKEFIKEVKVFDVFEGNNIEKGKKSIAIKVILQPINSTFTDEDIESICKKIIKNVNDATGGYIRK